MAKKITKKEKVWAYVLKNKTASAVQVSKATGVSYPYTYKLMKSIGTPKEVFEAEAKAEAKKHEPRFRSTILEQTWSLVSDDREVEHGDAHRNFETIADLWTAYTGYNISSVQVPMMMTLLKVARSKEKPHNVENYRDGIGYLALGAEHATLDED